MKLLHRTHLGLVLSLWRLRLHLWITPAKTKPEQIAPLTGDKA